MPRYEITGPDGARYEVTAPDGASEKDVLSYFQKNMGGQEDFATKAAGLSPTDLGVARSKNDAFGNYLREQAKVPKPGETPEQTDARLYGSLGYKGPGYLEGLARSYLQGSTSAGGDETVAGIAATLDPLRSGGGMGGTRAERYDAYLANERARLGQFREAYPASAIASEVVGAIPTALMLPMGAPAATLGGRVVAGGLAGGLQGMTYGALAGEGPEGRVRSAEQGLAVGGATGAALPVLGAGFERLADRFAANKFAADAPTTAALKAAKNAAYDSADAIAPAPSQTEFQQFIGNLSARLQKEAFDEGLHPKSAALLTRFAKEAQNPNGPVDLGILRKLTGNAAGSIDKADARIGKIIQQELDGFINNVSQPYSEALTSANEANGRYVRSLLMDKAVDKGERAASGAENGIRIQFRRILDNEKLRRGFSPEEIAAMERVANGTIPGNIARKVGAMSPGIAQQRNMLLAGLGGAGGAYTGSIVGGPVGAAIGGVGVPAVGYGAQKLAEHSTRRSADLARALVATGQVPPPSVTPQQLGRFASLLLGGPGAGPYSAQLRELIYQ